MDVLITERGIAVNPLRKDLEDRFRDAGLPLTSIEALRDLAERRAGKPDEVPFEDEIVGVMEYRDGTVIDVIRKLKK